MKTRKEVDLRVNFCGIPLESPFLLASAPPTATGDMIGRAFKAGWAGAVTKTLVMDASSILNVSPRLASLSYPGPRKGPKRIYALQNIELVTDRDFSVWLKEINALRRKYPTKLIVASIMDDASKPDGWQEMAKKCEEAGAHMIELNLSCPHGMPERGMGQAIGQDSRLSWQVTLWTAQAVGIPILAKMTPNVTDVGAVAAACEKAGASGISAINTVAAIIGVDLETLVPVPSVAGYSAYGGLSGPAIKPIALKAVSTIREAVTVPISAIGGISTWADAAEFLLMGATSLQICSAVMARGLGIIDEMKKGLVRYMARKNFWSVEDMIGVAQKKMVPLMTLDTKARVTAQIEPDICLQCDLCLVSCRDSGSQAITRSKEKGYRVIERRCTGCSLCYQVCPVPHCITMKPVKGTASLR
jgi:dihydropyrimidine dehydrogenase (NAD+) subunit PreA